MKFFPWGKTKSVTGIFEIFNNRSTGWRTSSFLQQNKSWVFACTDAIASNFSLVDLYLMEKTAAGVKESESEQAKKVLALLNRPNPTMTGRELRYIIASQIALDGNSFLQIIWNMAGTAPVELYPLNPAAVTIKTDDFGQVTGYEVTTNSAVKTLEPRQVLHFKNPSHLGTVRGKGYVEAAELFIDTDNSAAEWNRAFFDNAAQPDGVLTTDQTLSPEQAKLLQTRLEEFKGSKNAGKTMVLTNGFKFGRTGLSGKEMDFVEQRRFSRDAILAIFRVPKAILAISDDVNRASAEATKYNFIENNIKPKVELFCDQLTQLLLPHFKLDPATFYFDYDDPSPESLEAKSILYKNAIDAGWLSRNEVREIEGYEPTEGGDEPLVSAALVPLSVAAAQTEPPHADPTPAADPPQDPPANQTPDNQEQPTKSKSISDVKKKRLDDIATRRVAWINGYCGGQKSKAVAIYDKMRDHVLSQLKTKKSITKATIGELEDIFDEAWDVIIRVDLNNFNQKLIGDSATKAGEFAVEQFEINMQFDTQNPNVMGWIDEHALEYAAQVGKHARNEIREIFIDGMENGLSIDEMAAQIGDYFDTGKFWKATRLIRTEVIAGYNFGYLETLKQTGLKIGKVWSTMGDDRVDDECIENEAAGILPLDAKFPSGHLAPPVHPNCRCMIVSEDY